MKKVLLVKTRWEYYVANVTGILCLLAALIWFCTIAITETGIDFKSVFFWLALLLLFIIPYAFIGFFSSMKTVEVTTTGLIISYVFQKHKNMIHFSEVVEMKSPVTDHKAVGRPRTTRDTFKLILVDGRVFEFERAQFNQYEKLKATCLRMVRK